MTNFIDKYLIRPMKTGIIGALLYLGVCGAENWDAKKIWEYLLPDKIETESIIPISKEVDITLTTPQILDLDYYIWCHSMKTGIDIINVPREPVFDMVRMSKKIDTFDDAWTFYRMAFNPSKAISIIKEHSRGKTFKKKIELMAYMGGKFKKNFDPERAKDEGPRAKGEVNLEGLLAGRRSNYSGNPIDTGVCRDIHPETIKLTHYGMGIKSIYSLQFNTDDGKHINIVLDNPQNRAQVYKINYGLISKSEGVPGVESLNQDTDIPDIGIGFRIASPDKRTVLFLPSSKGGLLNKATDGEGEWLDPYYKSIHEFRRHILFSGPFKASTFKGKIPISTKDVIKGLTFSYKDRLKWKNITTNMDCGYARFKHSKKGITPVVLNQSYIRFNPSAILEIGEGFISSESMARFNYSIMMSHGKESKKRDIDKHKTFHLSQMLKTYAEIKGCLIEFSTGVSTDLFLAHNNVSLQAEGGTHLKASHITLSGYATMDIPGIGTSDMGIRFTSRDIGIGRYMQMSTYAGIDISQIGLSLYSGYEGAIDKELPIFVPGSARKIEIGIYKDLRDIMKIGLSHDISLEDGIPNRSMMRIIGSIGF